MVNSLIGVLTVALEGEMLTKHPIEQLQSVYIFGAVQMSTQAIQGCLEHSIPIGYFSPAGRFLGMTSGLPTSGTDARLGQYRLYGEPGLRAKLAARILSAKIHNQRVMLMRNGEAPKQVIDQLAALRDQAAKGDYTLDSLRGIEGSAAALYFEQFGTMLKGTAFENFDFNGRNRRPPKDPVNALLSMGYSILAKELTGICHAVGLDHPDEHGCQAPESLRDEATLQGLRDVAQDQRHAEQHDGGLHVDER